MIGKLYGVILDCPEPESLAEFYRHIFGGTLELDEDGWVDLILDTGLRLGFQRCPGYQPPAWPGSDGDQQLHLDIQVRSFDVAEAALLAIGARLIETHDEFRVYTDPVGHPFCTVR